MIGKTISHYRILEKLGGGGMGVVYKAEDTKLKRIVALKFLPPELTRDPEAKERFSREAEAASGLDHANICTIHEIDETDDGQMFICMACYTGETLKKKIERGPLKLDEALGIAVQAAEGLARAHEAGMAHRDIKPANLMMTERGELRIVDFGLAQLAGRTRLTKEGKTVGTVAYMSPEQARGEGVDARTDIWSLGAVLYEMLTGRLPFEGEYNEAIMYSIMNAVPEPVTALRSGLPMELERIVMKALEKDPSRRYQRMEEMLVDLKNLKDRVLSKDSKSAFVEPVGSGIRRRKILITAAALVVIALGLIVGVRIQVGRQPAAVAEENSLAVMYFNNLAEPGDPRRLGEIATSLLITDLSESEYLNVVSTQRLHDILALMGREGQKTIDRSVATRVAKQAGARWMLLGDILRVEPHIEIATQLVNVATGKVESSQRVRGEPGQEIFSLVDKLTVDIKSDLSLPARAKSEPDPQVADVTTSSPEAFRYYLEGVEYVNKMYYAEADKSFRKAIEHDSTFAMAYYQLAGAEREQGKGRGQEWIAKAMKYSHKASQKERHYIGFLSAVISLDEDVAVAELEKIVKRYPDEKDALFYLGILRRDNPGELAKAAEYLERVIEIDPLHKLSYNELSMIYQLMGDFEKSIWAINKYISLAPGEANPYDTRGELYAGQGKLDEAIESYEKALEMKPDFFISMGRVGHLYIFKKEYAKARECYRKLLSSDDRDIRASGRLHLAYIPLYQGKLNEALKVLDDGIAAGRMEGDYERYAAVKLDGKANIYLEQGKPDLALEEFELAIAAYEKARPDDPIGWKPFRAYFLAHAGRFREADEAASDLKRLFEEKCPECMYGYWGTMGIIEHLKGNTAVAVAHFEKSREMVPGAPNFLITYLHAKAYLDTGRHGDAVVTLEEALSRYDHGRAHTPIHSVKAHYLLGTAYEKSGWTKKAIEQYEEFLNTWKNADPGIDELEDAKVRLVRLKGTQAS